MAELSPTARPGAAASRLGQGVAGEGKAARAQHSAAHGAQVMAYSCNHPYGESLLQL